VGSSTNRARNGTTATKADGGKLFTGSAADFIPARPALSALPAAAQRCRGCDLYLHANQAVFGEGARKAEVMFVGEQPGDQEDLAGHPFVGPAGRVLDAAFEAAGMDRRKVYLTNAVKHFRFSRVELHKRRLHKTPNAMQVRACLPWLELEVQLVKPALIVALGSIAGKALLGPSFLVTRHRAELIESPWGTVFPTVHPSSVLRAPGLERERARMEFFRDIQRVAELSGRLAPA
jgi:uracil-DNA glycosylase